MRYIRINFKYKDLRFIFFLLLYKATLDILYAFFITPYYSYMGMDYSPNIYKYLIALIPFSFTLKQILKTYNRQNPSAIIVFLINLVYFIPGCTFYSFSTVNNEYFLFYSIYWILFNVLSLSIPKIGFDFIAIKNQKRVFYLLLFLVVAGSIFITGKYNGFKLNFSLFNVYSLRSAVSEMNLPTIIGYFKPIASSLIPIGAVLLFKQKRYFLFLSLVFVQLFLFAFGGHKTTLLILVVAIAAAIFIKEKYKDMIIPMLILINIMGMLETLIRGDLSYIVTFLQRRNMFTTNLISSWYYDFFSTNGPDYLHQSFLRYFGFKSDYDLSIPNMISLIYTGRVGGANNGMVGDAFANFGWLGLLIYPALIVLAFRLLDYCARGIDTAVIFTVSIIFTINFINSAFFTVLLTHGFILITLSLYFFPRAERREKLLPMYNIDKEMHDEA